jgi:Cu/Ag efflux pump CusA
VRVLQRGYTALLARVIRRTRWTYAAVVALTGIGIVIAPTLGQSFFPHFK